MKFQLKDLIKNLMSGFKNKQNQNKKIKMYKKFKNKQIYKNVKNVTNK